MISFFFTIQDVIKRNLILIKVAMEFFRFSMSDSPNLLPSLVQLKEKSVRPKYSARMPRFDGPQLFHCVESTKSWKCFKLSLWAEFRMCKNENRSFATGHLAWKECKNSQMSRGHKTTTWAKGQCGATPSSPRYSISGSPEVSVNQNSCIYTALPNDEVSGSCQLRHRRIISSINHHQLSVPAFPTVGGH